MTQPQVRASTLRTMLPGSAQHEDARASRKNNVRSGNTVRSTDAGEPTSAAQMSTVQLAQVINLHIGGYSLEQIGAAIGASAEEVDRLLSTETARYIRSQPALRTYVRNWVSDRYTKLLDAVWDTAVDKTDPRMLDHQDRALRILKEMTRLHGAEAPAQAEVKVEVAPDAVNALVQRIAAQQGIGYDDSIFDVIEGEEVHAAAEGAGLALEASSAAVEDPQPEDDLL